MTPPPDTDREVGVQFNLQEEERISAGLSSGRTPTLEEGQQRVHDSEGFTDRDPADLGPRAATNPRLHKDGRASAPYVRPGSQYAPPSNRIR